MTALLVIALSQISADSGAAGVGAPSADSRAQRPPVRVSAPERCPSARKAVRFYERRYVEWMAKMGAGDVNPLLPSVAKATARACPRYLARVWQRKAYAARQAYQRWHTYNYDWRSWLPPVWKHIIACETFSNFRHNSGTYQGAFGFHYDSWDRFKLAGYPADAYEATPRQQYEVALAIWRRFGFSGWGCA